MQVQSCRLHDDPRGHSAVVNRAWCNFLKWFHPLQLIGERRGRLGSHDGTKVPSGLTRLPQIGMGRGVVELRAQYPIPHHPASSRLIQTEIIKKTEGGLKRWSCKLLEEQEYHKRGPRWMMR